MITSDVHIIPINDLQTHIESMQCWCSPRRDLDEPLVVVHNSADGREFSEPDWKPTGLKYN